MRLEGLYTLPSGKVQYGEMLFEAAIRKTREEIGYFLEGKDLKMISVSDDINQYAHFVTIGFLAKSYKGTFMLKDSEEFTSYDWFSLDQLPVNLCFPSRVILNHYKENLIYDKEEKG